MSAELLKEVEQIMSCFTDLERQLLAELKPLEALRRPTRHDHAKIDHLRQTLVQLRNGLAPQEGTDARRKRPA